MKPFFTLLFLFSSYVLTAQTVTDFEDLSVPVDSFLNGSDMNGGFTTGNVFLPNSYNPMFNSWTGWAISATRDTVTPGLANQFSAITGIGVDSSLTYAVAFSQQNVLHLTNTAAGDTLAGMYITNNTYGYLSMREGDQFAKKFGGVSGDEPDFFLLTIKAYLNDTLSLDSVDFYLADYRFEDNSQDYIIDSWNYLDLTSLGKVDSLWFSLSSSDVGMFGMNTPAYFCVDNIGAEEMSTGIFSRPQPGISFNLYPNPSRSHIAVQNLETGRALGSIYTLEGQLVQKEIALQNDEAISIEHLPIGHYVFIVTEGSKYGAKIFIKN